VMLAIDLLLLDGSRFRDLAPHPFWIVVLLVTVQYGTKEGLVAAAAASAALLLGNVPEQRISQDAYQYVFSIVRAPFLWFTAAVVLGEIRMRHVGERAELRGALAQTERRAETLAEACTRLTRQNSGLETRVASQLQTVTTLYRASRAVERLEPGEVLLGVTELVRAVMNPKKFSVYILRQGALEAVVQDGWSSDDPYARIFTAASPLFQQVIGRQRTLCAASESDEKLLDEEGILAGPLLHAESGAVQGMLKIEELGFLDLGFGSVQNFKVVCDWIATAYARALRHEQAEQDRVLHGETQLYSHGFLSRQTRYVAVLARRLGFDLSSIHVRLQNLDELSAEAQARIPGVLRDTVGRVLRRTDLAFHADERGFEFALLLPGTPRDKAQIVIDKLRKGFAEILEGELAAARFSFTVQAVHEYEPPELFQEELFPRQTEFLANLAKRFGFDLSIVVLHATNPQELVLEDRQLIQGAINLAVSTVLPADTPAFTYERQDWHYPVVLPSAPVEEAQRYGDVIRVFVDKYLGDRKSRARLSFTVQSLESAGERTVPDVRHA